MERVVQRYETDCGVACLAMVTGRRYEEMFEALGFSVDDATYYTKHSKLTEVLRASGWVVQWKRFKRWSAIPGKAIVAVNHRRKRKYFHWVTFDGERIQDPLKVPYRTHKASGWYLLVSEASPLTS